MSHSIQEEETEQLQAMIDQAHILLDSLKGINPSKTDTIQKLTEIKKRVEYMLNEIQNTNI